MRGVVISDPKNDPNYFVLQDDDGEVSRICNFASRRLCECQVSTTVYQMLSIVRCTIMIFIIMLHCIVLIFKQMSQRGIWHPVAAMLIVYMTLQK